MVVKLKLGDNKKAIDLLVDSVGKYPNSSFYVDAGMAFIENLNFSKAEVFMLKALDLDANNPKVYYGMSSLYLDWMQNDPNSNKKELAIKALQEMNKRINWASSEHIEKRIKVLYLKNIAKLNYYQYRYKDAINSFKESLKFPESYSVEDEIFYYIAKSYNAMGEINESCLFWVKYNKIYLGDDFKANQRKSSVKQSIEKCL